MKLRLLRLWESAARSYWFVPMLMSVAGVGLALALGSLDARVQQAGDGVLARLYVSDAAGARAILSTLAGSAITVAGVVFSITIAVLSSASQQFGPRLLPNFMRHNGTQVVLGGFIATFIYSLLMLSMVRDGAGGAFVPQTGVAAGLALGVGAFALLIYFIHHVAVFIQAPRIIDDVTRRLGEALERSFPEPLESGADGREPERPALPARFDEEARPVGARRSGYVQAVDYGALLELACRRGILIRTLHRAGDFVIEGEPLALLHPAARVPDAAAQTLCEAFVTGPARTDTQDPEFAVDQLVEVALRALSPGINDPFTAINCIDRLGGALAYLARRRLAPAYRCDDDGRLRLVTDPITYAGVVDAAFNQIRQAAADSPAVAIRVLECIRAVARQDIPDAMRDALGRQARLLHDAAAAEFAVEHDREDLKARYSQARDALAGPDPV
jgi:uncharacterized membrane protein